MVFAHCVKSSDLELLPNKGVFMATDRRAQAYAEQFHGIFVARYIAAARANRTDVIPEAIREPISAYVDGRVPKSNVDANAWVKQTLYDYKVQNGRDFPLPPEFQGAGQTVGQAAMAGAATGAKIGLGIVAKSIFRLLR